MQMSSDQATVSRFAYRSDPKFSTIIDTLVMLAVPHTKGNHRVKRHAALDFFLFGTAMVAHPSLTDCPNMDPYTFKILESGRAKFIGPVPKSYTGPPFEPIPADKFIMLTLQKNLPQPTHKGEGVVEGHEPWLEEWHRAEAELDTFLGGTNPREVETNAHPE